MSKHRKERKKMIISAHAHLGTDRVFDEVRDEDDIIKIIDRI